MPYGEITLRQIPLRPFGIGNSNRLLRPKEPVKPLSKPILVTSPSLPTLAEYCQGLEEIWQNRWLTNSGPVHERFCGQLKEYFGAEHVSLYTNGTAALELAMQSMGLGGEAVTTAFTFVATSQAIVRAGLTPVFCDIEGGGYGIDPAAVEAAITPRTTAIVAVHVYGYPCELEALAGIASKHNLALIYDAAHAFGVEVDGESIGRFGDASMFSLHATKLFHSVEGGALVFADKEHNAKSESLRNFGLISGGGIPQIGTNAKMSELHALMGSLLLSRVDELIERRRQVCEAYRQGLADVAGVRIPDVPAEPVRYNYAYMPIEIDAKEFGLSRDELWEKLKEYNVFARRYFYPVLTDFECYKSAKCADDLLRSRQAAKQVLCLPLSSEFDLDIVNKVCDVIVECSGKQT